MQRRMPSSNSPWAKKVCPDLFRKPHGETSLPGLTIAHKGMVPVVGFSRLYPNCSATIRQPKHTISAEQFR
jgi:hypothetical protein